MLVAVTRVVSSRPFGVIFRARSLEGSLLPEGALMSVRVARRALVGEPCDGEAWMVQGEVADTPWGPQVEASRATRALPSGSLVVAYLAKHAPGIGPERGRRLWDAYGASLPVPSARRYADTMQHSCVGRQPRDDRGLFGRFNYHPREIRQPPQR